jgi:hypothetical protein
VEFEEFPGVSGESGPDDTEFRKSMDSLRRNKVTLKGASPSSCLVFPYLCVSGTPADVDHHPWTGITILRPYTIT